MNEQTNKKDPKNAISAELAQDQVDLFLEFYDIDPEFFPESTDVAIEAHISGLKKAIMRGRLSIQEKDESLIVVQRPARKGKNIPESLTYRELEGSHKVAMSKAGSDDSYIRLHTLMGALSKEGADVMAKLRGCDMGDMENLGNLFLLV